MATILDTGWDDQKPVEKATEDETNTTLESLEVPREDNLEEPQAEEIPDKYRGKSVQDLVQMHQEAEKAIGKQGSEVGELRKIVDSYITEQLASRAPKEEPVPEEEIDWFADPDEALNARINNHPTIKKIEESNEALFRQQSAEAVKQKHPDYQEILQDNAFAEWIKASKIRTQLFVNADQNYDFESADELFTNWKERKQAAERTVEADKTSRQTAVREASNGGARGAATQSRPKKYRRADIIKLMSEDPDRYAQMADEILLAYKENRVV